MPELPEVETVRRAIAPVLEGEVLGGITVRRRDLRRAVPPGLEARAAGRRVTEVARLAKYLLIHLDDGCVLLLHLGMSGHLMILPRPVPPPGAHDHVDLLIKDGGVVRFRDTRRFGLFDLIEPGGLQGDPRLRALGPDPLANSFDGQVLAGRLKGRGGAIKPLLMDQRIIGGLGNIYACESLFRAGISPLRKAGGVRAGRAENLARAIRDVLAEAIEAGGSSIRDHALPDGKLGYFQHHFRVYGRAGEACPGCQCDRVRGQGIKRVVQAGRSTFYCSHRQR